MSPSEKLCPHGQCTVPIVVDSSHPHYRRCPTIRASRTRMTSCAGRGIPGILLMRSSTFARSDGLTTVRLRSSTNRSACASFLASCPTTRLTLLVAGEKTSKGTPPAPVPRAPPTRKSDVRTPCTPVSPAAIRKCTCNPAARKAFAASISATAAVSPPLAARAFLRISEPPEMNPLFATTRAPLLPVPRDVSKGVQGAYSLPERKSTRLSFQHFQQRLGLLQVSGVKALGKPAIDLRQQLPGFGALALALPQSRQAHGAPPFQRLGLLAAS